MPHVDRECCLCDVVYCISSPVPNLELKPRFGEGSCVLGSKWAQETKPHSFFFFKKIVYLFLALLGFCGCMQPFSSCRKRGYSPAVSRTQASHCRGFSLQGLLLLQRVGCRRTGSVVVAVRLSSSMARGIFLD